MNATLQLLSDWNAVLNDLRYVIQRLDAHKDAITVIVLVPAACWTLWLYRKSKKKESAKWLQELFTSFYLGKDFYSIRTALEFDSETKVRPIVERVLTDDNVNATKEEQSLLCDLDNLLNYFEFILYLQERKQIKRSDCDALFDYWFGLLKQPENAYLRFYCRHCGYEEICQMIAGGKGCPEAPEYIAFYGSLRQGGGLHETLKIKDKLVLVGPCEIHGDLYDLGEYPGLAPGHSRVRGELFEIKDRTVFKALDDYEEFDPANPHTSLFRRRVVRLAHPAADSWVYYYNGKIPET